MKKSLKENYGDEKEKQRKLDLLQYQFREIDEAELKDGEEEKLDSQRKIILNSEKISKNLIEADNSLNNNVIDALNVAIRSLEKIEDFNSEYKEKLSELKNVYYDVQEITREISHLRDENIFDESQKK